MARRVWCGVSAHGYGHMAQMIPLIRALADRFGPLDLLIAGGPDRAVIERNLRLPFRQDPAPRDVGLVQHDPMTVDLPATAEALAAIHDDWEARLVREKAALAAFAPELILVDIPYLTIAAAAELGLPCVAIASLSWDQVLAAYFSLDEPRHRRWFDQMRAAYRQATLALLPEPAIPDMPFPRQVLIPPLARAGQRRPAALRRALGIAEDDGRPLALVTLGGIPRHDLPFAALAAETRLHWLLDVESPHPAAQIHGWRGLDPAWEFRDVLASVDGIVGKPGYGMAVESAANGAPFLYARRYTFPDEAPICAWLDRHGRGAEMDGETFRSGAWREPLLALMARPRPPAPALDGAEVAVEHIRALLGW